ncbi:MAG: hypothetical protein LKG15_07790 [Corynebacterium provencense]|jgi:hypothetical protein|uniref:hypothetical protein n=1 Tax=Corynebacterium provencense TaxID=1737425 RepID=UPI002989AB32|nr:hypothetical protein [Corynebacterium provencense]
MGDIAIQVTREGLSEAELRAAVVSDPEVQQAGESLLLLGKYRIQLEELDPGEWTIKLLDYGDLGSEFPFDRLYLHLEETTNWGLWTEYDDLYDFYKAEGILEKRREPPLAA